ncbi:MAG TPA: alkaline phosphatase family protein [Actinomycetota bacterium]
MPRKLTRRQFIQTASASASAALLTSFSRGITPVRAARPILGQAPAAIDTRWPIKRVVYVMLENRSFDAMFGRFPGANGATTGVKFGEEVPLVHLPEWLPGDLPHDRFSHIAQYNDGKLDGFALGKYGELYGYSQLDEADIPNYYHWAREFVLCDNLFASVAGPSHPNHLAFIAGTGAGAIDNPENIAVGQVDGEQVKSWGIDAYGEGVFVLVEDERGNLTKHSTRFDIPTVGEQLTDLGVDWVSYAPEPSQAGYIWNSYTAIPNVFETELYQAHSAFVDDLFTDIRAGALPPVTWVVPRFQLSDHPPFSTCFAHNWVTGIVNGIMKSPMWKETAIFITWDEWGGFYDHVPPPVKGKRELGFRVPMLVISPYAKRGYVDDVEGEFTSPLKFISDNWGLDYLTPEIAETHNFEQAFDFTQSPRPPDPRPLKRDCFGDAYQFPTDYPEWPEGLEISPPNVG